MSCNDTVRDTITTSSQLIDIVSLSFKGKMLSLLTLFLLTLLLLTLLLLTLHGTTHADTADAAAAAVLAWLCVFSSGSGFCVALCFQFWQRFQRGSVFSVLAAVSAWLLQCHCLLHSMGNAHQTNRK